MFLILSLLRLYFNLYIKIVDAYGVNFTSYHNLSVHSSSVIFNLFMSIPAVQDIKLLEVVYFLPHCKTLGGNF